jgi:hypothetical protein
VAQAFDPEPFDDLLVSYLRSVPLAAYDTGTSDAERFLEWLSRERALSPVELDHVACQRARHAVEALARRHRLAHVRFQELCSLAAELAGTLLANRDLFVYLNPIRVWTRFATPALLDAGAAPPADVLFFPRGTQMTTAVLEPPGRQRLRELEEYAPCTLEQWSVLSGEADREELADLCRDLAEMGLAAFG